MQKLISDLTTVYDTLGMLISRNSAVIMKLNESILVDMFLDTRKLKLLSFDELLYVIDLMFDNVKSDLKKENYIDIVNRCIDFANNFMFENCTFLDTKSTQLEVNIKIIDLLLLIYTKKVKTSKISCSEKEIISIENRIINNNYIFKCITMSCKDWNIINGNTVIPIGELLVTENNIDFIALSNISTNSNSIDLLQRVPIIVYNELSFGGNCNE